MWLSQAAYPDLQASKAAVLEFLFPRRRLLREIRSSWAVPGGKEPWLQERYFELTRADDDRLHVDEQTWGDLEFPRIFAQMDTTLTRLGSQCLFRQLRTYGDDSTAAEQSYESSQALRRDRELRERIQLILTALNADSAARVVEALYEGWIEGPGHPRLIVGWSVLCLSMTAALVASLVPLGLALLILAVNVTISVRTASRRYALIETLRALHRLVKVADRLGRLGAPGPVAPLAALAAGRASYTRLAGVFGWFRVLGALPFGLEAWLNLLFPAQALACLYTVRRLGAVREDLRGLYRQVGSLDATIAVASFLERMEHCRARFAPDGVLDIEAGYHPLTPQPVPNSLRLQGRSALISGSNMAGKTTFIKMVGINVILARTLGFCLARAARVPRAPAMACIRPEQSVEAGKSHYFAEIETILRFLRLQGEGGWPVFIIDEPFSGTNTAERVAAAAAVLGALSRRALVLATTHDVELQELLRGRFDRYYFTENPDLAGYFDFQLHQGPCYERNALKVLARVGFPQELIDEASTLAAAHGSAARVEVL